MDMLNAERIRVGYHGFCYIHHLTQNQFYYLCAHIQDYFFLKFIPPKELFKEHQLWEMFYEESPVLGSKDFGICCILYHLLQHHKILL